jgi:hypothetical protein
MTIEYDDKGKFFTDIITKDVVPVTIQTVTHRIDGCIHVRTGERVKDELDRDEKFLAVTEATVYAPDGKALLECKFMSIQRAQIVWVVPDEAHRIKAGTP